MKNTEKALKTISSMVYVKFFPVRLSGKLWIANLSDFMIWSKIVYTALYIFVDLWRIFLRGYYINVFALRVCPLNFSKWELLATMASLWYIRATTSSLANGCKTIQCEGSAYNTQQATTSVTTTYSRTVTTTQRPAAGNGTSTTNNPISLKQQLRGCWWTTVWSMRAPTAEWSSIRSRPSQSHAPRPLRSRIHLALW